MGEVRIQYRRSLSENPLLHVPRWTRIVSLSMPCLYARIVPLSMPCLCRGSVPPVKDVRRTAGDEIIDPAKTDEAGNKRDSTTHKTKQPQDKTRLEKTTTRQAKQDKTTTRQPQDTTITRQDKTRKDKTRHDKTRRTGGEFFGQSYSFIA
jgi:hypothetical protein